MITEDYVSFETAKLLKELGFDSRECLNSPYYAYNGEGEFSGPAWDTEYVAPTLQMARKWLREKHNTHIEIRITNHSMGKMVNVIKYYWVMASTETARWCDESTLHTKTFDTPEEAEENAIRHALENLVQNDAQTKDKE